MLNTYFTVIHTPYALHPLPFYHIYTVFHVCNAMWLFSCTGEDHNCCILDKLYPSLFWNSTKLMTQWAPAGCMGGDLEAINGDSKGKHSAKCQLWWLHCHNITSGRETQITKINNLIISYSNHAESRSGSYCSFISLVCWCIPIIKSEQADALKIKLLNREAGGPQLLISNRYFLTLIVSFMWCWYTWNIA